MAQSGGWSTCQIDSWILNGGTAWFRCQRGTLGCPRFHDGLSPHCIDCVDPEKTCRYHHDPAALPMTLESYREFTRGES